MICTPAREVPRVVQECGEAGIMGVVILSSGFREAGCAAANSCEEEIVEASQAAT